jgi:mycofactocin precursor peptide peptidase
MSRGLAAVTANGVLGDPTTATATEGDRVFAELVARLTADVERLRGRLGR